MEKSKFTDQIKTEFSVYGSTLSQKTDFFRLRLADGGLCRPVGYYETTLHAQDTAVATGFSDNLTSDDYPLMFLLGFPKDSGTLSVTFTPAYAGRKTISAPANNYPQNTFYDLTNKHISGYGIVIDLPNGGSENRRYNGTYKLEISSSSGRHWVYWLKQQYTQDYK